MLITMHIIYIPSMSMQHSECVMPYASVCSYMHTYVHVYKLRILKFT